MILAVPSRRSSRYSRSRDVTSTPNFMARRAKRLLCSCAPSGFAVGETAGRAGALMDAVRLVYMHVDGNRLVPENPEYSDWVGGDGGGTRRDSSATEAQSSDWPARSDSFQSLQLMYIAHRRRSPLRLPPTHARATQPRLVRRNASGRGRVPTESSLSLPSWKHLTVRRRRYLRPTAKQSPSRSTSSRPPIKST